ncbi:MAG: hypothetical protein KKB38_20080 [Gammaproteobacteria bacterium]|nr:hypothetical protein [Gammaproteobacteria bacterium]
MKVTILFNVLAVIVTVAQAFGFTGEVNPAHQVIVTFAIGLVNFILYVWKQYGNQDSSVIRNI